MEENEYKTVLQTSFNNQQSLIDHFESSIVRKTSEITSLSLTKTGSNKKVKSLAEAYLVSFDSTVRFMPATDISNIPITYLNLTLRVRHLIHLLNVFKDSEWSDVNLSLVLENLTHCLNKLFELEKLSLDQLDLGEYKSSLLLLLLNSSVLIDNAFKNKNVTKHLYALWTILNENSKVFSVKYFQPYLHMFLADFDRFETDENLAFICHLALLDQPAFVQLLNHFLTLLESDSAQTSIPRFQHFAHVLLKHQDFLFVENFNAKDELDTLEPFHLEALELFAKSLRSIFAHLIELDSSEWSFGNELIKFLHRAFGFKPLLFKLTLRTTVYSIQSKLKMGKRMKKFLAVDEPLYRIFQVIYFDCF
jgi:hypothetical protein